jgi:2-hydroxy-3-keto-5-methylthiopentenyl-1-phosphate phosphatase
MSDKKPIIFCDFDGSFTDKDIGYRLFTHFSGGRNKKVVQDWQQGLVSSRETLIRETALLECSLEDIHSYLDDFQLRPGAKDFYKIVKSQDIPFYIISEGLDTYIGYVLNKHGLGDLKYFCNRGILTDNRLRPEFLYDNYGCQRCGCCKGARIIDRVGRDNKEWFVIFIGDGLSDICALPHANLIFARGDLLKYCHEKKINTVEYENFFDIIDYLRKFGIFAE